MKKIILLMQLVILANAYAQPIVMDPTFGEQGVAYAIFPPMNSSATFSASNAKTMLFQPDGKILAAGTRTSAYNLTEMGLARFSADGIIDPTFGTNGVVATDFTVSGTPLSSDYDVINALALQPDNKIVAIGSTTNITQLNIHDVALTRYNPNGTLDVTFGVGGKVVTDFDGRPDSATDVVVQPDGKIIIVGKTGYVTVSGHPNMTGFGDFIVARYTSSGILDTTFGTGG